MASNDAELLARIRDGAVDDFAELVQRHQPRVFAILYRYERNPETLHDLAQETFIKAWRALDRFDGRAPFEHWLAKIAVHTALDHLRQQRRRRQEISVEDLGPEALEWLRSSEGRDELASRHAAELLATAMRELSPAEQLVITLQELQGLSVKEICQLTGSSSVAVRVRALRARAKLRRALERIERLAI